MTAQKIKRSGLPQAVKMRHDDHYVDLLTSRPSGPTIRMIFMGKIDPNPRQARSELGNIKELEASIKSKGVIEPIIVRPKEGRYEIIAGERRFIASKSAGLQELPCIVMDIKDHEAMEISLVENLQRKDLDVYEEADGLNALIDIYGYSHQQISEKIGKARSTITEILSIVKMPEELRNLCKKFKITSRSTLIEISKQKTKDDMAKLVKEIIERNLKREDTRELSKKIKGHTRKIRPFVYNYRGTGDEFYKLRIEFRKEEVNKEEIIKILSEIIEKLKLS